MLMLFANGRQVVKKEALMTPEESSREIKKALGAMEVEIDLRCHRSMDNSFFAFSSVIH